MIDIEQKTQEFLKKHAPTWYERIQKTDHPNELLKYRSCDHYDENGYEITQDDLANYHSCIVGEVWNGDMYGDEDECTTCQAYGDNLFTYAMKDLSIEFGAHLDMFRKHWETEHKPLPRAEL